MNTRLGVHFALDVVSEFGEVEIQTTAEDGPLHITETLLPIKEIKVPIEIDQPSGIQHRGTTIYISTDQTELFELDSNFKITRSVPQLISGPLLFKQGELEGIEVVGDTVLAIGEFGAIKKWQRQQDQWVELEEEPLLAEIAEIEFSGITQTEEGRYATSEDAPVIVNLETGKLNALNFDSVLKDGQSVAGLELSGLATVGNKYIVLTESHTSLLIVNRDSYQVEEVLAIEACAAADIAVRDGKAYIIVDHNYFDERPPIYVYDISKYLK